MLTVGVAVRSKILELSFCLAVRCFISIDIALVRSRLEYELATEDRTRRVIRPRRQPRIAYRPTYTLRERLRWFRSRHATEACRFLRRKR